MNPIITDALTQCRESLEELLAKEYTLSQIDCAGRMLADSLRHEGRVYSCGNGGSMCDAMHFAEELSGRFREDRPPLPAMAISDPGYLTCCANDYGYQEVFARFVAAHGRRGDVFLGISTSGKSENVIHAAHKARELGLKVLTLTGQPDSPLGELSDIDICTPCQSPYSDRVQELHIKIIHILIELVESQLFNSKD